MSGLSLVAVVQLRLWLGCKREVLGTLHLLHWGVMWKVFFLVLGMGAIVDNVNGGLLAPESPHWAIGALVDLFVLWAAFGPRKAHTSHNQSMLQCGLA